MDQYNPCECYAVSIPTEIERQTTKRVSWYVYGHGVPSQGFHLHTSLDSAMKEAKRLAALNPDQVFQVLQTVGAFINPSAIKMNIQDDSIPF